MADAEAKAVIKVSADTKQAVNAINGLTSAQKTLTKEIQGTRAGFSSMVGTVADGFAKFNLAAGGVATAFNMLNAGLDAAFDVERRKNMEKMLAPGTLDRLRDATDKLIPRTQILGVAVKAMNGDFALTEKQMATVLKASVTLAEQGYGTVAQVADKLNEALIEGVDRLDNYGINLEKTGDRQADVNAALEKMDQLVRDMPIDEQSRSLRTLRDDLNSVGESIRDMTAAAVRGISSVYDAVRNAPGTLSDDASDMMMDLFGGGSESSLDRYRNAQAKRDRERARAASRAAAARPSDADIAEQELIDSNIAASEAWERAQQWNRSGGGGRSRRDPGAGYTRRTIFGEEGSGEFGSWSGLSGAETGGNTQFGQGSMFLRSLGDDAAYAAETLRPVDQALSDISDRATLTGQSFGVFQDAFGSAVAAAIDGSKGIGEAFADAAAAGLKAMAIEHAVRALGEGAFALTSLAFGDARGAALHGAAAGKHALVAAAAGVGAAALGGIGGGGGGGGGGAGAAAGGAAGAGYSRGADSGAGGGDIIINLGDGFIGSPQQVGEEITRAVRKANQRGQRSGYTTSFEGG
jgi:hypothetical protein